MKFDEFEVGMVIHHPLVKITQTEMLEFAQKYDPQFFHVDEERAKQSHWNGVIGSGWLTCSKVMRMAVDAALHDSESFGSPGLESLRWLYPVRPDDSIRLEAVVTAKRVSSSRDDLGILRWVWNVYNQDDQQVMEVDATSLFDLKQS